MKITLCCNRTKSLSQHSRLFSPLGLTAQAGTISGKVSGGKGSAVVYVDTIPGKTFPAPDKHVVMDQKSLLFQPHVLVVLAGRNRRLPEQRHGGSTTSSGP